jgi:hypothetical protein
MEIVTAACTDSAMKELDLIPVSIGLFVRTYHYGKLSLVRSEDAGAYLQSRAQGAYQGSSAKAAYNRARRLHEAWGTVAAQKEASCAFLGGQDVTARINSLLGVSKVSFISFAVRMQSKLPSPAVKVPGAK